MWDSKKLYIIAEIGVNHNGDVQVAKALIDASKDAGADAVKFQTFRAETLVTQEAPKAAYQDENDGRFQSQFEMLKALELSYDAHRGLKAYCEEKQIDFLSTPFDEKSADFLDEIGVHGFKTSSGDLNNLGFMAHLARKGKPMIISTGMSYMNEVEKAVAVIRDHGDPALSILHCVSNYPAALSDCNLRAMQSLSDAFGKMIGWSDHTISEASAVMAVRLGARIVEKHITLDKEMVGPDHKASMNIPEFQAYVSALRTAEREYAAGAVSIPDEAEIMLGDGVKAPQPSELPVRAVAMKSLFAAKPIPAGVAITPAHIKALRPSDQGIGTIDYFDVIGQVAAQGIDDGAALNWSMFGCDAQAA